MNPFPDWAEPIHIKEVILERFKFHASSTFSLEALSMMAVRNSNVEVHAMRFYDELARQLVVTVYSYIAKGETTHESKTIEHSYEFNVFDSWMDHLKFRIKERWNWLPKKLAKHLTVRYQKIVQKRSDTVPISVIRVCPHATFSWENYDYKHIHFLFPNLLKE